MARVSLRTANTRTKKSGGSKGVKKKVGAPFGNKNAKKKK